MEIQRRATLRCLTEDLHPWAGSNESGKVAVLRDLVRARLAGEVEDSAVARALRDLTHLSKLSHPLVRSFDAAFASDGPEVLRESISAVRDHLWWKQKTGRWRGAATEVTAPEDDRNAAESIVWLCAGGLRHDGSADDFYVSFAADCGSGSDKYLPSAEDYELLRIERKTSRLQAWQLQVQMTCLVLVAHALSEGSAGPVSVKSPDASQEIAEISAENVEVEVGTEVLREVLLVVRPLVDTAATSELFRISLAVLHSAPDEVRVAPLGGVGSRDMSFAAYVSEELVEEVGRAMRDEPLARTPGEIRPGTRAHFTSRDHVTLATIEGLPVEAVCGHWFVPRSDFDNIPTCVTCTEIYESLD